MTPGLFSGTNTGSGTVSLSKVIEVARGELGEHENPPGSNRVKYWDAYDKSFQGQPWCVGFLWWVFQRAGERMAFFGGGKTASCSMLLRWYKEQGLTVPVEDVQKGDIVLLNFHGKSEPEHCGLVELVNYADSVKNMCAWTIEGNTTPGYEGSQDNGGCVASKMRFGSQIVAVCRPQYKAEDPQPVYDYVGRWSEKAIKETLHDGVLNGYPDGSFQPTKQVTREELAQFYLNLKEKGLLR